MILVTGATGASGSAVIREFVRRELPVRALVRDPAKLPAGTLPSSVQVVSGDMREPDTLVEALDGVHRVLMISSADRNLVETQCRFVDAAQRAGVSHIVKFSGRGCYPDSEFRFARMHGEIERYLERSGLAWTHLRPSQFMHVYFREIPTILGEGALRLPMADARLAPIDVADIAEVAVAVLHGDGHEGKRYEMTGPEALTMTEVAETISSVIGTPVRYVDISPERKSAELREAGLAPFFVEAMDELFRLRRRNLDEARVELGTHERFGLTPTRFEEFVRRNAEVFLGEATRRAHWATGWRTAS
jgi:uncharacterized protein YbjT (DUF2867 family)